MSEYSVRLTNYAGIWFADVYIGRRLIQSFIKRNHATIVALLNERYPEWKNTGSQP